jgi:cell division protein FtsZ
MDTYDIFDDQAKSAENSGPDAQHSSADMETPFPKTASDPLGIAGGADALSPKNKTSQDNITKSEVAMKFDLPDHSSIIKVIGVGGGGSNAVNHMYRQGINGVDFVVCNTDKQALDMSPVPHKIVLGATLTEGRGAGSLPEVGRNAAIENIEDIRRILANNTRMVFITAGMGGGTGTGAAPIIAGIAREMGILTVGIVTIPFLFEGKKRRQQAEDGLEQLKQNVDTLLVISNDKLREMYGNLKLSDAFSHADDVLAIAAKSIAEIISLTQQINVDFADICTVMRNSGVAIMGSSVTSGENRSIRAVEAALNSPLLNDNNITGARYVLLNIVSGVDEITMDELGEITDYIQEAAGQTAEIIKGYGVETSLGDSVSVTIIATGFNQNSPVAYEYSRKPAQEKVVRKLDEPKALVEEPKAEAKPETVNPLEPFLINKQPEPQPEMKIETKTEAPVAEVVNPLEPFLKSEEPVKAEVAPEPVAAVTNPLEPVLIVKETVQEEIVAEVSTPVAEEMLPVAEMLSEEVKEEVVPVANENVEFEITNLSEPAAENWNEASTVVAETNIETWSEEENVNFVSEESVSMETSSETFMDTSVNEISSSSSQEEPAMEMKEEMTSSFVNEPVAEVKEEPVAEINLAAEEEAKRAQAEEIQRKAQERIQRLKELSMKLKTPQGLNEMEHEPAYKRRNIQLDNVPHSSESQVSRFTLTENEEKKVEIRPNNSFLHDNVD